MSDSDDTDILLLIPPDFFLSTSLVEELKENQQKEEFFLDSSSLHESPTLRYDWKYTESMDSQAQHPAGSQANMVSNSFKFLSPRRQTELNHINNHLSTIEKDFSSRSDISTISNCTVHSQFSEECKNRRSSLVHSTPKCPQLSKEQSQKVATVEGCNECPVDDGVLHEIDNFLENRNYNSLWNGNEITSYPFGDTVNNMNCNGQPIGVPNAANHSEVDKPSCNVDISCKSRVPIQQQRQHDNNLISLSEIWGKNGQSSHLSLKEERYRRVHLEKTVRTLQGKLLEYQQKLSVAIEVDRAKDAALSRTHAENYKLNQEILRLRNAVLKLETKQKEYTEKTESIQKELSHALALSAKFQDKNESLETELEKTTESSGKFKKQIEELEFRIQNCKISEELSISEINKIKEKLAKAEYQLEKATTRSEELEKECETLKNQKDLLQDYHQKQKIRADVLESQKKSLENAVANLTDKETTLTKKLETQRQGLKSHYQQQLENVVSQKLREFQEQLDKVEESFKSESRSLERLIAERAVKQLELINEKNELELSLMQEKHNEEVELFRIQLANASKKIDDQEEKLSAYKSKRAEMAEKLHSVMETQWHKALEILTSPNSMRNNHNIRHNEGEKTEDSLIEERRRSEDDHQSTAENELFQTPTSSRTKKATESANVPESSAVPAVPHVDKLQAYIELLLSKSPTDFDNLDQILALTKHKTFASGKQIKSTKRTANDKPPWKA